MEILLGSFLKVSDTQLIQISHISNIELRNKDLTYVYVDTNPTPIVINCDIIAFFQEIEEKHKQAVSRMQFGPGGPGVLVRPN